MFEELEQKNETQMIHRHSLTLMVTLIALFMLPL